jgi:hypothetical protein
MVNAVVSSLPASFYSSQKVILYRCVVVVVVVSSLQDAYCAIRVVFDTGNIQSYPIPVSRER